MDFSTILNDGSGPAGAAGAPAAANPPPPPPARPASQYQHQQQYHQQPPQQQALPSTPIQTVPPHSFNDHPQSIQPSPARSMSRDYHPSQGPPFGSPPPHSASNPYATSRPQPPALPHLASNHDMRSPSAGPPVAHSPYTRTTPAASARADYPFPSPGHPPHPDSTASPIQQHRYPPSGGYPPRDSYSQPSGPMASPGPAVHTTAGYFSGQPMPQTPPVGTPGGAHSYLTHQHQRSASAQSHHSYPPNQPYASPIVTNHPPPPSDHMRQPSQPPTPHGPPLSAATRQASGAGTFAQPPSPFQPRGSSSGAPHPPYPPHHPVQHPPPPPPPHLQQQQQQQLHQQPSPHVTPRLQPSPHPSTQRAPSGYEQPQIHPHAVDPHRTSLSQSERERSVSVSPKTRVPSLPSSAGHHSQASFSGPSGQPAELDSRDPRQLAPNNAHMRDAPVKLEREAPHASAPRAERASTPAKRKMDDRDIKLEDLDRQEPRPPPFQSNGEPRPGTSSRPPAVHHSDSPMPPRRRRRHAAPPSWAQPYERQQLRNPNYQLRKHAGGHTHVNGAAESNSGARQERQERATSRHVSPEASRANPPGPPPTQSAPGPAIASMPQLLGPWETTIDNKEPFDEMCKVVADFLLFNVVIPPELADVHGRPGYQFEVEAKLGELRNGREPGRIQLPVLTEVVLDDARSSFAFSSNMSETQHKLYNEFLNQLVTDSSPQNPKNMNSPNPRVPVNYVHTREIDKFFRLPADIREHIPPVLRQRMRNDASIRVTTDRSGRLVAKIVKVHISNLHIFLPNCGLDCRITVNVEIDFPGPVEGLEQIMLDGAGSRGDKPDRHKDRLTYTQGLYRVDLTQVTQPEAPVQAKDKPKTHELEIELNAEALVDQGRRVLAGEPHNYDFLVGGFVNNIRMLARKARQLEHEAKEKGVKKTQQAQQHQH